MDFFGIRRQKTLSESSDASTDGAVINTGKQPQQLSIGDASSGQVKDGQQQQEQQQLRQQQQQQREQLGGGGGKVDHATSQGQKFEYMYDIEGKIPYRYYEDKSNFFGGLTRNAASNPEMGYFYDVDSGRTAFTVYHEDSHKHMFRTVQRP